MLARTLSVTVSLLQALRHVLRPHLTRILNVVYPLMTLVNLTEQERKLLGQVIVLAHLLAPVSKKSQAYLHNDDEADAVNTSTKETQKSASTTSTSAASSTQQALAALPEDPWNILFGRLIVTIHLLLNELSPADSYGNPLSTSSSSSFSADVHQPLACLTEWKNGLEKADNLLRIEHYKSTLLSLFSIFSSLLNLEFISSVANNTNSATTIGIPVQLVLELFSRLTGLELSRTALSVYNGKYLSNFGILLCIPSLHAQVILLSAALLEQLGHSIAPFAHWLCEIAVELHRRYGFDLSLRRYSHPNILRGLYAFSSRLVNIFGSSLVGPLITPMLKATLSDVSVIVQAKQTLSARAKAAAQAAIFSTSSSSISNTGSNKKKKDNDGLNPAVSLDVAHAAGGDLPISVLTMIAQAATKYLHCILSQCGDSLPLTLHLAIDKTLLGLVTALVHTSQDKWSVHDEYKQLLIQCIVSSTLISPPSSSHILKSTPLLPFTVRLLRQGMVDTSSSSAAFAAFCSQQLRVLIPLLHPRASPVLIPPSTGLMDELSSLDRRGRQSEREKEAVNALLPTNPFAQMIPVIPSPEQSYVLADKQLLIQQRNSKRERETEMQDEDHQPTTKLKSSAIEKNISAPPAISSSTSNKNNSLDQTSSTQSSSSNQGPTSKDDQENEEKEEEGEEEEEIEEAEATTKSTASAAQAEESDKDEQEDGEDNTVEGTKHTAVSDNTHFPSTVLSSTNLLTTADDTLENEENMEDIVDAGPDPEDEQGNLWSL